MTVRNEQTSKRVAKIAGSITALSTSANNKVVILVSRNERNALQVLGTRVKAICTGAQLKAVSASCLTQAADRAK